MDSNQKKIANIHDFSLDFNYVSSRLNELKNQYLSGLILPLIGSDIKSPAPPKMVEEINQCQYLSKVILVLSTDDWKEYEEASRLSRQFKVPCDVAWCNKPDVKSVLYELKHRASCNCIIWKR